MSKTGQTVSKRTAALRTWIQKTFATVSPAHLTSESVAAQATGDLKFPVSANRVARELYRQGLIFRRVPGDPPRPAWSKNELNRTRMDYLERRIRALEKHSFGKPKRRFVPRSDKETKKRTGPAAAGSDPDAAA